jgi:hypothetical protein
MARAMLFQTHCGAPGDMILAGPDRISGIRVKEAMQMALGAIHEKHGPGKN